MKNYALAWTNLTKFICQKDKQRTFGTFKLLANFLDNKAQVFLLQGDLFLLFLEKNQAIECYVKAAQIYVLENKLIQAIAIYNHIYILEPLNIKYILKLTKLYFDINDKAKIKNYLFLLKSELNSHRQINNQVDLHKFIEQIFKEIEINDHNFSRFICQFINTIK